MFALDLNNNNLGFQFHPVLASPSIALYSTETVLEFLHLLNALFKYTS